MPTERNTWAAKSPCASSDKRGDDLVRGVLGLVDRLKPLHVTLVGGEPMVRHRELSRILPELSGRGIFTMVVTSGIIPIPMEWICLPRFVAAVSIDGLPNTTTCGAIQLRMSAFSATSPAAP